MGNVGRSTIDIVADDKQARQTYRNFFDFIEKAAQQFAQKMTGFNPMGAIESEVERATDSIGKHIDKLPEHLKPFHESLNTTRMELRDMGRIGTTSLNEMADAAVRNQVALKDMNSATKSGKEAAKVIQGIAAATKETQLAILGLNQDGTIRISTEESEKRMEQFQEEIADARKELEKFKDQGDFSSFEAGTKALELQLAKVNKTLYAAAKGGATYNKAINELGVHTADSANRAAIAMESYRDRFLSSVAEMEAKATKSKKMMDILPEVSSIEAVDKAFLSITDRLEEMAKKGNAATLAIEALGKDASMKDLMDRITLINDGLGRMQQLAVVVGVAFVAFTAIMANASYGPDPAKVAAEQQELTQIYQDELDKRAQAIYDFASLFENVEIEWFDAQQLAANLQEQVEVMRSWSDNMKSIAGRVPVELKEELYKMGPAAAGEIAALASMSDTELNKYVALWQEKHRLAREAAVDELSTLKSETDQKIKELEASLKPLGIAAENFKSTWAEALKPFVELWGEVAAKVVDAGTAIGEFVNKLNELNPDIVKMAGSFLYLMTAITLILSPMAIGIGKADGMKAAFTQLWKAIGPVATGFARVAGMASLVSAAIVIVVGSLMKMWDASEKLRTSVVDGWEKMTTAFNEGFNAFNTGASDSTGFWELLGDALSLVVDIIVILLTPAFEGIGLLLGGTVKVIETVINALGDFGSALGDVADFFISKLPGITGFDAFMTNQHGAVSKGTQSILGEYFKMDNDIRQSLMNIQLNHETINGQIADGMIEKYANMTEYAVQKINERNEKETGALQKLFDDSYVLTAEEEQKRIEQLNTTHAEREAKLNENNVRIAEIWRTAANEHREITNSEKLEIAALQEEMRVTTIEGLSKNQMEQKVIFENIRTQASDLTAQQAAAVVQNSADARDKVIADAHKTYNDKVASIIKMRDETGVITKEEADAMIAEAGRQRDGAITAAKETHQTVVDEAKNKAKGHVEHVNWETGEVKSKYEVMKNEVKTKISDLVKDAAQKWESMKTDTANKVEQTKNDVVNKFESMKKDAVNKFNSMKNEIVDKVEQTKNDVVNKFESMKNDTVKKWESMKKDAANKFNELKNKIVDPIKDAWNDFSKYVEKIKNAFNFELKFPKITMPELPKLPQPKITGNFSLNPPSVPSITWHANGGFFDRATVIGIGEAGPEAAVPLVGRRMDPFADAVFRRLMEQMGPLMGNSSHTPAYGDINQYITVNSPRVLSEAEIARKTKQESRMLFSELL